MTAFAILVKSHGPDRDYVERLLDSFARHNADSVPTLPRRAGCRPRRFERLAREHVTLMPGGFALT